MVVVTFDVKHMIDLMFYLGALLVLVGGILSARMTTGSIRRTKRSSAIKTDALFLSFTSPGFKRFSMFNSPDELGFGIYEALALEQVGAINDIKPRVDVNLTLYPNWPEAYLSAARYYAIIGDEKKARDYLSIADTISKANSKYTNRISLLSPDAIEEIISKEHKIKNTTSIDKIFEEIRNKPYQLLQVRSLFVLLYGVCLVFLSILINIVNQFKLFS